MELSKSSLIKQTITVIALLSFSITYAQIVNSITSVNSEQIDELVREALAQNQNTSNFNFQLKHSSASYLLQAKYQEKTKQGWILFGKVHDFTQGTFEIENSLGVISGKMILEQERKSFDILSLPGDELSLVEVIHGRHSCTLREELEILPPPLEDSEGGSPTYDVPAVPADLYEIESKPGANGVIFIDADGHYLDDAWWTNFYGARSLEAANITDEEFYSIYLTIVEDYSALDLSITTSETIYNSYSKGSKTRLIITNESFTASSTGWSPISGFDNEYASVCFRNGFSGSTMAYKLGEVCSHEIGHNLGLRHDGYDNPADTTNNTSYYRGHGSGTIATRLWGPLMGSTYYTDISQFSKGEYDYANRDEDDYEIMTSAEFGLGFRTDEHGDDINSASPLTIQANGDVLSNDNLGVISTQEDLDVFEFTTSGGQVDISVSPTAYKPNLDPKLELLDANGIVIDSANPNSIQDANLIVSLTAGKYFIRIDGVGYLSASLGYTDYGSRGQYNIFGSIPIATVSSSEQNSSENSSSSSSDVSSSIEASSSSEILDCDTLPNCVDDMQDNWSNGDQCYHNGFQWTAEYWVDTTPGDGIEGWAKGQECSDATSSEVQVSSLEISSSSDSLTPLTYGYYSKFDWKINSQGVLVKDLKSSATVTIYNQLGQEIETIQTNGVGFFDWQKPISNGTYYVSLKSTHFIEYKKMNIR